ncbi:zinc c6 transcription factor [Ophiostoma piceae UAMH 11346]|uniref:Zinc c6 transcription factor n=1 Tax=Ophiostoma piceae (strain UAMH 11346) TaxID=1262450 RepID=S3CL22_OPHP1|nr:zinc c6 transcription factor [Ophiostoma piceae UAMH 11346]
MADDTSEIPAGYFTTFSLSDPNGLTPETLVRAQRRNRRVFVCIPCHRKKLKCDKLSPCSRCLAAGIPNECSYQPPPTTSNTAKRTRKVSRNDMKRDLSPGASFGSPCSSSSLDPCSFRSTPASKTTNGTSLGSSEDDEWGVSQPLIKPLNGATHWARIACGFGEAVPYLFGTECHWQQRYREVKNLECLFTNLNGSTNFPFSNSSVSKCQILRSFPPNHIIDTLVANYMDTFGTTHYLFHASQLSYDVQTAVSDEWLAQFCMVLALGAEAAPRYLFSSLGQSAAEWAGIFLSAAQASFSRSSYMAAPSLSTVRTLCMMVIAKLVEIPASGGSTCGSGAHSPLVSLMSFTVQTAKTLQLHRSASAALHRTTMVGDSPMEEQNSSLEAEMRRRIWVTVRLLDLETSLRSGTTTHSEAGDAEPPQDHTTTGSSCNSSDIFSIECIHDGLCQDTGCFGSNSFSSSSDIRLDFGYENDKGRDADYDYLYQKQLFSFLPLLASIINTVNSSTKPSPTPRQVAAWAASVQKCLGDINSLVRDEDDARTANQTFRSATQSQHLRTVANRVLLASQHDLFCDSLASLGPPSPEAQLAQSAVIESSLALLNTQKNWATSAADFAGPCPNTCADLATAENVVSVDTPFSLLRTLQPVFDFPGLPGTSLLVTKAPAVHTTAWLLDLCHDDFAAALMYIVLAWRAMHCESQNHDESDIFGLQSAGGETAAAAVRSGYQIMRDRSNRSVAHFNEFFGIAIVFACFRGLDSGDMLSQVVEATNDVEQVVVAGRRDLLWAADSYTPDEALMFSTPTMPYSL